MIEEIQGTLYTDPQAQVPAGYCPRCGGAELTYLHKKAKKSNNDWKCPACGEIYRTINLFMDLPDK